MKKVSLLAAVFLGVLLGLTGCNYSPEDYSKEQQAQNRKAQEEFSRNK